jgi:hypothetical protein
MTPEICGTRRILAEGKRELWGRNLERVVIVCGSLADVFRHRRALRIALDGCDAEVRVVGVLRNLVLGVRLVIEQVVGWGG